MKKMFIFTLLPITIFAFFGFGENKRLTPDEALAYYRQGKILVCANSDGNVLVDRSFTPMRIAGTTFFQKRNMVTGGGTFALADKCKLKQ